MASPLYGSGLRLLECAQLRVKELDLNLLELTVRDGTERKERVTVFSGSLRAPFGAHVAIGREEGYTRASPTRPGIRLSGRRGPVVADSSEGYYQLDAKKPTASMKNQYFGDVNDFGKYGVLRALADAGLSIGVCWLLTADDAGGDGELRRYLSKPSRWRNYDAGLYDILQRLQQPGVSRNVTCADKWGLVQGATFFDEILTDNIDQRNDYFRTALAALRRCDVLFFDPDNGIEVPSTGRGRRGSAKYIYWSELHEAYENGHSLLVYQHFPRVERTRFVPFLADRLRDEIGAPRVEGFATSHVAFFLVHQAGHSAAIEKAVETVQSKWSGQIDIWPQDQGTVNMACSRRRLV